MSVRVMKKLHVGSVCRKRLHGSRGEFDCLRSAVSCCFVQCVRCGPPPRIVRSASEFAREISHRLGNTCEDAVVAIPWLPGVYCPCQRAEVDFGGYHRAGTLMSGVAAQNALGYERPLQTTGRTNAMKSLLRVAAFALTCSLLGTNAFAQAPSAPAAAEADVQTKAAQRVDGRTKTAKSAKIRDCREQAKAQHFGVHFIKRNKWIKDCVARSS